MVPLKWDVGDRCVALVNGRWQRATVRALSVEPGRLACVELVDGEGFFDVPVHAIDLAVLPFPPVPEEIAGEGGIEG